MSLSFTLAFRNPIYRGERRLSKSAVPEKKVVVGNPAKIVKDVSDEMIKWKAEGTKLYQQLPAECYATLKECDPLREIDPNRPKQQDIYKIWKETNE